MLLIILIVLIVLIVLLIRKLIIDSLHISSRDVRALTAIRRVLKLLCADQNIASFNPTRDRSAYIPGQSRRKNRHRRNI